MIKQNIDGVSFDMKEEHDFSFLEEYGKVFCVFAKNDSGNISFGVDNGAKKYFIKVAGAKTTESATTPRKAIASLKKAVPIYKDLAHPHLIEIIEDFFIDGLYVAVFKWAYGDCLFDFWNFEQYERNNELSPSERFKAMPIEKKLNAFNVIFEFLVYIESKDYVAIDFYDGSIIYDFEKDAVTICDIDFFAKGPQVNTIGKSFVGTKRLKSPEEYIFSAKIDAVTNVFTMGALLLHYFGSYSEKEIREMYRKNKFFPCKKETWTLSDALYEVAIKATSYEREKRYASIKEFCDRWQFNR